MSIQKNSAKTETKGIDARKHIFFKKESVKNRQDSHGIYGGNNIISFSSPSYGCREFSCLQTLLYEAQTNYNKKEQHTKREGGNRERESITARDNLIELIVTKYSKVSVDDIMDSLWIDEELLVFRPKTILEILHQLSFYNLDGVWLRKSRERLIQEEYLRLLLFDNIAKFDIALQDKTVTWDIYKECIIYAGDDEYFFSIGENDIFEVLYNHDGKCDYDYFVEKSGCIDVTAYIGLKDKRHVDLVCKALCYMFEDKEMLIYLEDDGFCLAPTTIYNTAEFTNTVLDVCTRESALKNPKPSVKDEANLDNV